MSDAATDAPRWPRVLEGERVAAPKAPPERCGEKKVWFAGWPPGHQLRICRELTVPRAPGAGRRADAWRGAVFATGRVPRIRRWPRVPSLHGAHLMRTSPSSSRSQSRRGSSACLRLRQQHHHHHRFTGGTTGDYGTTAPPHHHHDATTGVTTGRCGAGAAAGAVPTVAVPAACDAPLERELADGGDRRRRARRRRPSTTAHRVHHDVQTPSPTLAAPHRLVRARLHAPTLTASLTGRPAGAPPARLHPSSATCIAAGSCVGVTRGHRTPAQHVLHRRPTAARGRATPLCRRRSASGVALCVPIVRHPPDGCPLGAPRGWSSRPGKTFVPVRLRNPAGDGALPC